jgi:hypothetical protein
MMMMMNETDNFFHDSKHLVCEKNQQSTVPAERLIGTSREIRLKKFPDSLQNASNLGSLTAKSIMLEKTKSEQISHVCRINAR